MFNARKVSSSFVLVWNDQLSFTTEIYRLVSLLVSRYLTTFRYIHLKAQATAEGSQPTHKRYLWPTSFPHCTPSLRILSHMPSFIHLVVLLLLLLLRQGNRTMAWTSFCTKISSEMSHTRWPNGNRKNIIRSFSTWSCQLFQGSMEPRYMVGLCSIFGLR